MSISFSDNIFIIFLPVKEACFILLQTIPGNINMDHFESNLKKKFPQIHSYHDLHIWQLSSQTYIATVHIIFQNPKMYAKTIDEVRQHFHDHSIANVTIQPEFYDENGPSSSSLECLVQCTKPECLDKVCCKDSLTDLREVSVCSGPDGSGHVLSHDHDIKSCSNTKNHNDHHCHSKKHEHGHSHKHNKHNCSHKHVNKVHIEPNQYEVPKESCETQQESAKNLTEVSNNMQNKLENYIRPTTEAPADGEITKTSTLTTEKTEISELSQALSNHMAIKESS